MSRVKEDANNKDATLVIVAMLIIIHSADLFQEIS